MKNKKTIIVGIITFIMILIIGASFALYNYQKNGSNDTKMIAGDIYMRYLNGNTKSISMTPSDTYNAEDYYEFTIEGKNTSNQSIVYDIKLNHGNDDNSKTRLDDKFLRFRLVTVDDNNVETEVVPEIGYENINNTTIHVDTIGTTNQNEKLETTYRLYTWVEGVIVGNVPGATYDQDEWLDVYTNIKVDVTGDFTEKEETSSVTITFNPNGGSVTPTSKVYTTSTTYGTLPTPTKVGYNFLGWYLESTFTTLVTSSMTVDAEKTTLYAKWGQNIATITLNNNNPTNTPTTSLTYNILTNEITPSTIVLPQKNFVVSGFETSVSRKSNNALISSTSNITSTATFNGWYTSDNDGSLVLLNNTTPTLQQNVSGYTDNNSKWLRQENTTIYAKYTQQSITLPTITKTGYTCGYTEDSSGTTITYETGETITPVKDTELYAVCDPTIYTITLDNQSATTNGTETVYEKYNTGYYTNSEATTQMTTSANGITLPAKTGYTFGGYYTETNGSGTQYIDADGKITSNASTTNFTGNGTLYAKWTANTYTVTYNGNGATSGNTASSSHTYDVSKNLTTNGYTRAYNVTYNYNGATGENATASFTATATFNGWATSENGSKAYDNNQSVVNLTSTNNGTVNLFANWTLANVILPTPTKTGYIFDGWYSDSGLTTKVGVAGASYTPTENKILYAKWTPISYTISYNLNGGSASNPTSYNVETNTITLNNPTKTGYTFMGWTGSNDLSSGVSQYTTSNPFIAGVRDNRVGNRFDVVPGTTYRVVITAKRTSGSLNMNGGIWYEVYTDGTPYDTFEGEFIQAETLEDGWARYYKDVTVSNGKSKGTIYIELNQSTGNFTTSWSIADMHVIERDASVTIPKGSTGNKTYTANWIAPAYTITNLVTNGSFENGFTGWTKVKATETVTDLHSINNQYVKYGNNSVQRLANNVSGGWNYVEQSVPFIVNHKYYYFLYGYTNSTTSQRISSDVSHRSNSKIFINVTNNSGWVKGSVIYTGLYTEDNAISINYDVTTDTTYVDGIGIVDLTAAFGAGNEPSKEWCDTHIDYFDGTTTVYK